MSDITLLRVIPDVTWTQSYIYIYIYKIPQLLINCCYWFMFSTICILSLISENIRAFKKKLNLKFGGKKFESWMYSLKILKGIKYQPIELQSSWQIKYQTSINGPMVSCLWIDRWREKKEKRKKKNGEWYYLNICFVTHLWLVETFVLGLWLV